MKKILMVLVLALLIPTSAPPASGATFQCTWTANTEADLAGYRLFQRTAGSSYDYAAPTAEIPAGTEVCTLENIPDGDYRWVLRAFDAADNESEDSNEVSYLLDEPPGAVQGFG